MLALLKPEVYFPDVGLKMGDIIIFNETGEQVQISSTGDSLIVQLIDRERGPRTELFSLSIVVKRHLGRELRDDEDLFEFFTYQGKTLRRMFEEQSPFAV